MSQRKQTRTPRTSAAKKRGERGRGEREQPGRDGEALDVTWDQPQPGYPAPERPRDRAEEPELISSRRSRARSR
jgi:hypothetical protein